MVVLGFGRRPGDSRAWPQAATPILLQVGVLGESLGVHFEESSACPCTPLAIQRQQFGWSGEGGGITPRYYWVSPSSPLSVSPHIPPATTRLLNCPKEKEWSLNC